MLTRAKIALVVNVDWFFLSHRLPIARAAKEVGAEVLVLTRDTGRANEIRRAGFEFHPIPFPQKSGISPFAELSTIRALDGAYRSLKPDLIHHNTIRPVVYGSLAAARLGNAAIVNTMSGLGFLFSEDLRARALRKFVRPLLRRALRGSRTRTIVHNPDDLELLVRRGFLDRERAVVILGSGVDLARFSPAPVPEGPPLVLLAGRMLWTKGIREFVEASRRVRMRHPETRFILVGEPYPGNPDSVREEQLRAWEENGTVEWWGYRDDMPDILRRATILVLPSYREGAPKVLLEAAAVGRPMVATDVPGCRDIVDHGSTGFLVPPRNSERLAEAILELLQDPVRRSQFGAAGRHRAVSEFSEERVAAATLALYKQLLEE